MSRIQGCWEDSSSDWCIILDKYSSFVPSGGQPDSQESGGGGRGGNWEKNAPKNAVNFLCVLSNKKELEVPAIGHRWRGAPLAPSLVNSEHQLS